MSCSNAIYTTNVDCCFLQIICNGVIVNEFDLSQLRVIDKGSSYAIKDKKSGMSFENSEIDLTAEEVRTLRCDCMTAAAGACGYLESGTNYLFQGNYGWGYLFPANTQDAIDFLKTALGTYLDVPCNVGSYYDNAAGLFWIVQNQNGVVVLVSADAAT